MLTKLALFISNVDVSSIHTAAQQLASVVAAFLTPVLLIIAIYVRILRDSLDTFSGGHEGRWARAVKDFLLWGAVCATYFGIGTLIINFANSIYAWCDSIGGLQLITGDMSAVTKAIAAKNDADQASGASGYLLTLLATGNGVFTLITGAFYYFSLLVVAFIEAVMRIAQAMCFGIAFVWGLIAIPVSVSQGITLLRGWGLLMGFSLVWPLMQALVIALIRPPLITIINKLITDQTNAGVDMLTADITLTVLNLIFAAACLTAPFLTNALVSNAPAASAVVSPFVGAAMAGAATAFEGTKMAAGVGGRKTAFSLPGIVKASARGSFGNHASGSGSGQGTQKPPAMDDMSSDKQKPQSRGIIMGRQRGEG